MSHNDSFINQRWLFRENNPINNIFTVSNGRSTAILLQNGSIAA
ncbi:hypothetical protein [Photorhabdus sp. SF281]